MKFSTDRELKFQMTKSNQNDQKVTKKWPKSDQKVT